MASVGNSLSSEETGTAQLANLDEPVIYRKFDPSGFGGRLASMPLQCRDAWLRAQTFAVPDGYRKVQRLLVLGMGGSAIGGDLASDLQDASGSTPIEVHRGYGRTTPVDDGTLVIASSYSGNTEETLSAFERAWKPGVKVIACTRGGALATRCQMLGLPVFPVEFEGEPRCALGYGLFAILGFLQRLGLAPDRSTDVVETIGLMQRMVTALGPQMPAERNLAKELALRAQGKTMVILGAQHLTATARRWKTQVAENAKELAFAEALPEADHNLIEGLPFPKGAASRFLWVLLESDLYNPRIALRYSLTRDLLEEAGYACEEHLPQGKSLLAQVMTTVLFGDYVSYYMAMANGVDPAATPALNRFKDRMAGR